MSSHDAGIAWPNLLLLAVVLAGVIFVVPLWIQFPLFDPDEGLHASIAQEMVERGDWITPTFLGERFFDKPILYFWVQALSLKLLGSDEIAVRLPGLMFGLFGAATTALLGWRMLGRATGLIAGILYATTILPTALAQAASHDVALVPWINLTMLFLWESQRAAAAPAAIARAVAAGVFLGLSILTKGLVGVGVVGLAYGSYLLIARRLSVAMVLRGMAVLAAAALVASPWYILVETHNPGYLRYFFLERHLLGLVSASQPHSNQPWWYYLPILIGGGLPWIGQLPILVKDGLAPGDWRSRDSLATPAALLWCWLISWTVFLMLARSKLATYLWPLFPPMAVLAAIVWTRLLDGTLSRGAQKSFARSFVCSSWAGLLVLPAAALVVQIVFGVRFTWPVWAAVGLAAALAPLPLLPWYAGRMKTATGSARACIIARSEPLLVATPVPVFIQATLVAATLSLAGQFLVVMTMIVPSVAGVFSARSGRTFQPLGPHSAALARGRRTNRIVRVLSRSAAPSRAEGGATPRAVRRPGAPLATRRYDRPARTQTVTRGRVSRSRGQSLPNGRPLSALSHKVDAAYRRVYFFRQRDSQRANHPGSRPTSRNSAATRHPTAAPANTSLG